MQLQLVEQPEELLAVAFRKARKEAAKISLGKQKDAGRKNREIAAVKVAASYLRKRLWDAVRGFPSVSSLHPFYEELFEAIIDVGRTKSAVAHISEAAKIIEKIEIQILSKMRLTSSRNVPLVNKAKKAFFGRTASVVKTLGKSIASYNDAARKLRELPKIDFMAKTVILAGYPNTGKTTMLKRLTGSNPKIASYAFTTTQLNIGYFEQKHKTIQVIDTPGLLDKPGGKRNAIEKKAIAALTHLADIIVFVADASMHCGYPLAKQKKLFEEIEKEFPGKKILLVFNKSDITGVSEAKKAIKEFGKNPIMEGEGRESMIRQEIEKALI